MAVLTPAPKMQFFDINGEPLVGGKVYTYQAGTTTPLATYTDNTNAYANPNPVILNARGEAAIWIGGLNYKFKLTDANDVEIWTVDYISGPISGVSPALSGNVTIDTNSSSPALKITQTGTGYALRVQDETDPDTTPLVIDTTGKLGVGTLSPSELVDISGGNLAFTAAAGTLYAKVTPGASLTDIAAAGARALTLTTNSVERVRITDTGLVGIGKTPAAGVELDVLGDISASVSVITDTISERTAAAGVTIDGVLCKDSQVAPANRVITAATAQATTSGNSKDFGSIPSWVKRVTVLFDRVSFSTTTDYIAIRLGTGGTPSTTGYQASVGQTNTTGAGFTAASSTSNIPLSPAAYPISALFSGSVVLNNVTGNTWVASGVITGWDSPTAVYALSVSGSIALGGALDIVRVLTNGGAAFDAGSVNILYE